MGHQGLSLLKQSKAQRVRFPYRILPSSVSSGLILGLHVCPKMAASLGIQLPWQHEGSPRRCKRGRGPESEEGYEFDHSGCAVPSSPHLKGRSPSGAQVGRGPASGFMAEGATCCVPLQTQPVILGDLGDLGTVEHRNRRIIL